MYVTLLLSILLFFIWIPIFQTHSQKNYYNDDPNSNNFVSVFGLNCIRLCNHIANANNKPRYIVSRLILNVIYCVIHPTLHAATHLTPLWENTSRHEYSDWSTQWWRWSCTNIFECIQLNDHFHWEDENSNAKTDYNTIKESWNIHVKDNIVV